jgi:FkbM family methyltransferase
MCWDKIDRIDSFRRQARWLACKLTFDREGNLMSFLEFARRRAGYKLPRVATWIIRGLNYFVHCEVTTELIPGVKVHLDLKDDMQRSSYWMGLTYEHPAPAILSTWCANGVTTFFDIGANFGFYSYYILASNPGVTVYSFEPNPKLYAQQLETKTRNQLIHFFPVNLGLSDEDATLALYIASANSGYSTFGSHPELVKRADKVTSSVTSFDEWTQKTQLSLPRTSTWIAKIDVEGYEVKVLNGMRRALQAQAFQGLCIEVNQYTLANCGATSQAIYALMESCGYQAYDEQMQKTQPQTNEFRNVFFLPS